MERLAFWIDNGNYSILLSPNVTNLEYGAWIRRHSHILYTDGISVALEVVAMRSENTLDSRGML